MKVYRHLVKGSKIRVRPSRALGTEATLATVVKIIHKPGHHYYRDGLVMVRTHDDHEVGCECDFEGRVFIGPPGADGFLVCAP